jgi:hypothetical protein
MKAIASPDSRILLWNAKLQFAVRVRFFIAADNQSQTSWQDIICGIPNPTKVANLP